MVNAKSAHPHNGESRLPLRSFPFVVDYKLLGCVVEIVRFAGRKAELLPIKIKQTSTSTQKHWSSQTTLAKVVARHAMCISSRTGDFRLLAQAFRFNHGGLRCQDFQQYEVFSLPLW
jgi:hypothetical protein